MKKKISITLEEDLIEKLQTITNKTAFNQSSLINFMLEDFLFLLEEMESLIIKNDKDDNSVKYVGMVSLSSYMRKKYL